MREQPPVFDPELTEFADALGNYPVLGREDSSPNNHATAHNRESGHPIICSAEPGEDWSWCYADQVAFSVVSG